MPVESVFDRLYRQSTEASASRVAATSQIASERQSAITNSASSDAHRLSPPNVSSLSKQRGKSSTDASKESKEESKSQTQVAPSKPYSGPWKLTYTSKYDKITPKTISDLSPQALDLSSDLRSFAQGHMDEQRFAGNLIEALFHRDHMRGDHWDYDPAYATKEESSDDGVIKFKAEKEATWDWKDIYSVASAKGTICFFSDHHEIRVDEYSYYAAG
jgi:hypothetical protein